LIRSDGMDNEQDVPYGEDWQRADEVAAWIDAADRKRPWRAQLRARIADEVAALGSEARVLELGSGPGLLAECILQRCPDVACYTLLDFSASMLAVSRERLAAFPAARFVAASFKAADWIDEVAAPFDCVVSMQAIHELRHKRHAPQLYRQIHQVTRATGHVLICDHLPPDDSPKSQALYMTEDEQFRALSLAGFARIRTVLTLNGLPLYAGEKADM
jgi:ubiquinone/menaquinone biosynthesis C-methylase UbiE